MERKIRGVIMFTSLKEEDDFVFSEKLHELNEELERLNAEAHELEEKIAENVVTILEERPNE
jgi:type I restriction enzyme M protein